MSAGNGFSNLAARWPPPAEVIRLESKSRGAHCLGRVGGNSSENRQVVTRVTGEKAQLTIFRGWRRQFAHNERIRDALRHAQIFLQRNRFIAGRQLPDFHAIPSLAGDFRGGNIGLVSLAFEFASERLGIGFSVVRCHLNHPNRRWVYALRRPCRFGFGTTAGFNLV